MPDKTETSLIPEWGDRAVQMAREGKNVEEIRKELNVDYWDVWNHIRKSEGITGVGWRGAKWIITHRLKRLVKEKDPAKREKLSREASECASYLYDSAKALGNKIDSARKSLG